jgi:DNA polymerase-4
MTIDATCKVKDIYAAVATLLTNNWSKEPVRLLGISLSGFDKNSEQISFFEAFNTNEDSLEDKIDSLEDTIHQLRQKYGTEIIKPGIHVKQEKI